MSDVEDVVYELAETKYWDRFGQQVPTIFPVTYNGLILNLSDIPQNVTVKSRTGDRLRIFKILVNVSFRLPAITEGYIPTDEYIYRVILFVWKDDTVPVVTDILDFDDGVNTDSSVLSFYRMDKIVKRDILFDETFNASYALALISGSPIINGVYDTCQTIRIEDNSLIDVYYESGTTTGVNKIYMLLIDNAFIDDTLNRCWITTWTSRICFKDF